MVCKRLHSPRLHSIGLSSLYSSRMKIQQEQKRETLQHQHTEQGMGVTACGCHSSPRSPRDCTYPRPGSQEEPVSRASPPRTHPGARKTGCTETLYPDGLETSSPQLTPRILDALCHPVNRAKCFCRVFPEPEPTTLLRVRGC